MTPERIIDKIRKLRAHAESAQRIGNEAEAEAFAAKVQELLTEHKLALTDVELAKIDDEDPVDRRMISYDEYEQAQVEVKRRRCAWVEQLARGIAAGHFCEFLVHPGSSRITFVGRKSDTEVAAYMLLTLQRTVQEICEREFGIKYRQATNAGDTSGMYGWKASFYEGFASRISHRYFAQKFETRTKAEDNSTALVRLDSSAEAIERFKKAIKVRKGYSINSPSSYNADGNQSGKRAGDEQNLSGRALRRSGKDAKQLN